MSRYCSTVDQRPGSGGLPSRPELIWTNRRKSSCEWNGAYELPSMPISSVVMPWRTFGSCCGLGEDDEPGVRVHVDEAGQTTCPVASMRRRPRCRRVAAQDAHALALDGDGAVEARVAGAVDDESPADQQVEHRGLSRQASELVARGPRAGQCVARTSFVLGECSSGARAWRGMPRGYVDRSRWSRRLPGRHWVNLLGHASLRAARQPSTYSHVGLGLPGRSRLACSQLAPSAGGQTGPLLPGPGPQGWRTCAPEHPPSGTRLSERWLIGSGRI